MNRGWTEPDAGTTIYIADNGIHADIIMPVSADGLDWAPCSRERLRRADPDARWIAFGSGEERVYLDTPTWWDITPRTIWSALTGGRRVMHVEYVPSPDLRGARDPACGPEEYRRLWAAIRADFALDASGQAAADRPSGLRPARRFLPGRLARPTRSAPATPSAAHWLRLAGVKTSLWPPFVHGLIWRYRRMNAD